MQLNKSSWIVRWAYFSDTRGGRYIIPPSTNLCPLFWRCVGLTPLFLVLAGSLVVVFAPLILIGWLAEKALPKPRREAIDASIGSWVAGSRAAQSALSF